HFVPRRRFHFGVGASAGIRKHESTDALREPGPERKSNVAAHRNPNDVADGYAQFVEETAQFVRRLVHRPWRCRLRLAEAPDVWSNDAKAGGKRANLGRPHRLVQRKSMDQKERRAAALIKITDGARLQLNLHGWREYFALMLS